VDQFIDYYVHLRLSQLTPVYPSLHWHQ